jgi:hypothetical protein
MNETRKYTSSCSVEGMHESHGPDQSEKKMRKIRKKKPWQLFFDVERSAHRTNPFLKISEKINKGHENSLRAEF